MHKYCTLLITNLFTICLLLSSQVFADPAAEHKGDGTDILKLDLATAQKIALADSPTLAAASSRVQQAKARLRQARSQYWPSLDLSSSATDKRLSDNAHTSSLAAAQLLNPQATVDIAEEYYTADLTLTWVLFNGFERRFANAVARHNYLGSEQALLDSHRILLSAVATGFYNAVLGSEKIKIAKADETYNRRLLREAQARRQVGTGSLSEELNFKIKVQSALSDLLQAENDYLSATYGLAALLGRNKPFSHDLTLIGNTVVEEKVQVPEISILEEYAIKNRPDILQGKMTKDEAIAGIGKAKANFYPSISLAAAMSGEKTGSSSMTNDDFGSSVAAKLSYNIFAGDQHRAKLHEANAARDEAQRQLDTLVISVRDQVRQARTRLLFAQKQYQLQKTTAELVQQNRNLVEKEYAVGQASLTRLNEAQKDLTQTESRLAQAKVGVMLAWQDLKAVTGENISIMNPQGHLE